MIRHLLIALAVLVPFTALVVLGFSLLKDPPPYVQPPALVRIEPPPAPVPVRPPPPPLPPREPVRPLPPPLPIAVPVVAPPPPPPPEAKPEYVDLTVEPKKQQPMLASVEPLVQQCFKDISERMREPLRVTVAFNAGSDGRFENVVIKKTSWQDPQLTACVLDAFSDVHFLPGELRLKRQSYTFTFGVPDGGR